MEIELLDEPATALTVTARASLALSSEQTRKDLQALVAKSVNIKEVKNAAGRDECHSAAMVLVKARTTIEKTGKAARDDATQFSKAVIAEEKALISITQPEEARLMALRDAWDAARAAEKAEAERKERARVEAIQLRIADIRECAVLASQCRTSAAVDALIGKLQADPLQGFEEFSDEAEGVRVKALGRMREIRDEKYEAEQAAAREKAEREAEAARLAQERAELERQRAEQAERNRKAREEAAAAQKALDDARQAQEAELQRQRAAIAAEQEAAAAQLRADRKRMDEERAELEYLQDEITRKARAARQAEADQLATEDAEAVCDVATSASCETFNQEDGDDLLDNSVTANDNSGWPSDDEIIGVAVASVAKAFGMTRNDAINRLAEVQEWLSVEA